MDSLLIERIADEVIRRIRELSSDAEEVAGTLVILSSHLVGAGAAMQALRKQFTANLLIAPVGVEFDCIAEGTAVMRDATQQKLLEKAAESKDIVLLAPKISQIENIAYGREGGIAEEAVIRSLLWGKSVHVLLDFAPPRFKRGTFYEKIGDALDALTDMGVTVGTYSCIPAAQPGALSLVTENEVVAAFARNDTRIACQRGAIITPAAKDKAAELKIKIDG